MSASAAKLGLSKKHENSAVLLTLTLSDMTDIVTHLRLKVPHIKEIDCDRPNNSLKNILQRRSSIQLAYRFMLHNIILHPDLLLAGRARYVHCCMKQITDGDDTQTTYKHEQNK